MTVYEPGGACLTRTQHEQQVFQRQWQQKALSTPATAATAQVAPATATQQAQAVQPVQDAERAPTAGSGGLLDVKA